MKPRTRLALLTLTLVMGTLAHAQERRQGGPPPYDPTNEVTVSGRVTGTETVDEGPSGARLILMLTVNDVATGIILGPDTWVTQQGVTFTPGATAQVVGLTGYRYDGHPAMQARSVKVGSKVLTLRDASGKPLWEGRY